MDIHRPGKSVLTQFPFRKSIRRYSCFPFTFGRLHGETSIGGVAADRTYTQTPNGRTPWCKRLPTLLSHSLCVNRTNESRCGHSRYACRTVTGFGEGGRAALEQSRREGAVGTRGARRCAAFDVGRRAAAGERAFAARTAGRHAAGRCHGPAGQPRRLRVRASRHARPTASTTPPRRACRASAQDMPLRSFP